MTLRMMQCLAAALVVIATLIEASPLIHFGPDVDSKTLETRALAKRGISNIDCGLFATADQYDAQNQADRMREKDGDAEIAAESCARLGCYDTTGLYLCNDNDEDIFVSHQYIRNVSYYITDSCQSYDSRYLSGRMIMDEGWNLVVSYCNGGDSTASDPADYETPGPNGDPAKSCGVGTDEDCSFAGCEPDTIEIDDSELVTCNEYLGPTYVGPGAQYTYSTTRNVGTSWSVGAFLSIDSSDLAPVAAQLGIFASFTETTTVGDVSGSTQTCGEEGANGTFTCTMDIAPKCWKLRGTCEARYESDDLGRVPWAASFPQVEEGDEQAIYTANVCVCPNCPGADEEAAPEYVCNLDCATCNTPSEG